MKKISYAQNFEDIILLEPLKTKRLYDILFTSDRRFQIYNFYKLDGDKY